MSRYYVSRGAVTAAVVALLLLAGASWWIVIVVGALVLGFFLVAPRSGRYVLKSERGVTALRRDERTQLVVNKAGRNGFVALMLAAAAAGIYWGSIAKNRCPRFHPLSAGGARLGGVLHVRLLAAPQVAATQSLGVRVGSSRDWPNG